MPPQYIGFAEDMMLILFLVCILATLVTVHRATCYRQFQVPPNPQLKMETRTKGGETEHAAASPHPNCRGPTSALFSYQFQPYLKS